MAKHRSIRSVLGVGVIHSMLLTSALIAFDGPICLKSMLLIILLGVASSSEFLLSHDDEGPVPILVLTSAFALLIEFLISLMSPHDGVVQAILGTFLVIAGIVLRGLAIDELGPLFVSGYRAKVRIVSGIYRSIRHPSEIGQLSLGLGAATLMNSFAGFCWWLLVIVPLAMLRLRYEEDALRKLS